jgi:cytidylate kinase
VDERPTSWLGECLDAFANVRTVSTNAYVRRLVKMLGALASQGECVIVGRGAAQILSPDRTLRVRLIAPRHDRIEAIRQRRGLSAADAEAWVDRTDRERTAFVKEHFFRDPADVACYDLVLNSSRLGPQGCTDLILEALQYTQAPEAARRAAAGASAEVVSP